MYSSELVALLLQASQSARAKLTEKIDGMDILLRVRNKTINSLEDSYEFRKTFT